MLVASDSSPLYKITYGDIAFLRFWGYECRLAANAVVLVLGWYQLSIATYLRGVSRPYTGGIRWVRSKPPPPPPGDFRWFIDGICLLILSSILLFTCMIYGISEHGEMHWCWLVIVIMNCVGLSLSGFHEMILKTVLYHCIVLL